MSVRLPAAAALAVLSFVPLVALAEAPVLNVEQSIAIDAPPERVWSYVSDFTGIHRWLPQIASTRIISGTNRQVGCIREITRWNGTKVEEKLVEYEPQGMRIAYTYAEGQWGFSDYHPEMTVHALPDGKSQVVWKASFRRLAYGSDTAPPGQEDATLTGNLTRLYQAGLTNLKRVSEGR